jgi:hypothetical protein
MQQQQGRGGGLASHRTPVRLDVLVHTDPRHGTGKSEDYDDALAAGETLSILATLHSWARVIREDRALAAPGTVTISGERDTLSRHLDYAVAQPWCDEFYGDIAALVGQLKAANGHRADRPFSACPSIDNGAQCTGNVWIQDEIQPVWRRYTDRCAQSWESAPGSAVCDMCGRTWTTPGEKARLDKMVDQMKAELARPRTDDGRPMMTAEELAAEHKKTVNAIRILATRAGVKALAGHYDPQALGLTADHLSLRQAALSSGEGPGAFCFLDQRPPLARLPVSE